MEDVFHMVKMPPRQPPLQAGVLVSPIHQPRRSPASSPRQDVCNWVQGDLGNWEGKDGIWQAPMAPMITLIRVVNGIPSGM